MGLPLQAGKAPHLRRRAVMPQNCYRSMMLESNLQKELDVKNYITSLGSQNVPSLFSKILLCHGLNIKFNLFDETLKKVLNNSFPKDFDFYPQETEILSYTEVDWYSSDNLNIKWDDSGDHQCMFSQIDGKSLTVQRDFACFHQSDNKILLFSNPLIDDGFFNFLRYFIPVALLKHDRFVFHSSCVLNERDEATLFLGHSGWGKSTISSMFPAGRVLGDDMNIVHIKDDQILVEPTHLGQMIINWEKQGQRYLIKNFFWLNKSDTGKKVVLKEMSPAEQRLKILGSLSGLFWEQIKHSESQKVFLLLQKVLKHNSVKHFLFSRSSEVAQYV